MVYTSTLLPLAFLEVLVHIDPLEEPDFVSISAELPVAETTLRRDAEALLSGLPNDWRRVGHPALRRIGTQWAESGSAVALMVPSVVVDGEWNVLINPLHPDAKQIVLAKPLSMRFDQRLFKPKS
jgi:RES domain-containing protein